MGRATVTDPFINSITVSCQNREHYLQTSPEFAMKRLLASLGAELGAIYSLGKAFRNGESGRRHNPEFTMLEWYRPGFDDIQLMAEVADLLTQLLLITSIKYFSYGQLFQHYFNINPYQQNAAQLKQLAQTQMTIDLDDDCPDTWLDLLISNCLEPKLASDFPDALVFIYDYPESQAALARVLPNSDGQPVAKRFEGFFRGMELCNGYWELTDAAEQNRRFEADQAKRLQLNLPQNPSDACLLAALESGLPDCAGVALGVDRLLMLQQNLSSLSQVIAFPTDRS